MGYVVPPETLAKIRETIASYGEKLPKHSDYGAFTSDYGWFGDVTWGSGVARALAVDMMVGGGGKYLPLEWPEIVKRFEFTERQLRAGVATLVSSGLARVTSPLTDPSLQYEHEQLGWTCDVLLLLCPSRLVQEAWDAEITRVKAEQRRAKIAARGGRVNRATIPGVIKAQVYARDDFTCQKCGATENLTLDHIHPWSKGGPDAVENLRVLCRSCNSSKGARA